MWRTLRRLVSSDRKRTGRQRQEKALRRRRMTLDCVYKNKRKSAGRDQGSRASEALLFGSQIVAEAAAEGYGQASYILTLS